MQYTICLQDIKNMQKAAIKKKKERNKKMKNCIKNGRNLQKKILPKTQHISGTELRN